MKKILTSKITMAIVACLLLVGIFAGVSVLAGDSTPEVKITSTNLAYDAEAKLVYNVQVDNITDPVGPSNLTMLFWSENPGADASAATASATEYQYSAWNGGDFDAALYSKGIAPQKMTQVIWAAAKYTADNGDAYYSDVVRYSVIEQLSAMKLKGGTNAQEGLWTAMTDYITYAQEYLNYDLSKPGDLVYVKVIGGTIANDNNTHGMYAKGSQITVKADTSNGNTFKRWRDARYNTITDAAAEYTVTLTEDSIFRANFERITGIDKSVYISTNVQLPDGVVDSEGVIKAYANNLVPVLNADTSVPVYFRVTNNETNMPGMLTANNVDNGVGSVHAVASGVIGETTYYFSHWIDENGNKVSDTLAYIVEMGAEDRTFTAVYTDTNPVKYDNTWTGAADGNYDLVDSSTTAGKQQALTNAGFDEFGSKIVLDFDLTILPYNETAASGIFHFKLGSSDINPSGSVLDTDLNTILFCSVEYNATNGFYLTISDRVGGQNYYKAQMRPFMKDIDQPHNIRIEVEIIKNANGTYSNGYIHCIYDGHHVMSTPVTNTDTFVATGDLCSRLAANSSTIGTFRFENYTVGTN